MLKRYFTYFGELSYVFPILFAFFVVLILAFISVNIDASDKGEVFFVWGLLACLLTMFILLGITKWGVDKCTKSNSLE